MSKKTMPAHEEILWNYGPAYINIGKVEVIFVLIENSNLLTTFISSILRCQEASYAHKQNSGCQVQHEVVHWIHVVSS